MTSSAADSPLDTPILFLIYRRLDTTKRVFQAIRKAQPRKLYIACDGPKESNAKEKENVEEVRKYVLSSIDWDCKVERLFRRNNLGCKIGVSTAIDWFFENESKGIILEDDCLPSHSFFKYCEDLLDRYQNNDRIGQICGFNCIGNTETEYDYVYSKYGPIWGWASWRRAWKVYDVDMKTWPNVRDQKLFRRYITSRAEEKIRIKTYDDVCNNTIDTWDYQWGYAKMDNSMLSIVPAKNLVENIGFTSDATHTSHAPEFHHGVSRKELVLSNYNDNIVSDLCYEEEFLNRVILNRQRPLKRIARIIRRIFE